MRDPIARCFGPSLWAVAFTLLFAPVRAQLVHIPDANLRVLLNDAVPGLVDADGSMETTNPDIATLTQLHLLVDWAPADMTGLVYLTGLQTLSMVNSGGNCVIPAFPEGLRSLMMEHFAGVEMSSFPSTLEVFMASDGTIEQPAGDLAALPDLPASLRWLDLKMVNSLAELPLLPAGLETLGIEGAQSITALPGAWPSGLAYMSIKNTGITSIPSFPATLTELTLHGAPVSALPALPPMLLALSLAALPGVTVLPDLPGALLSLDLATLEALPSIPAVPAALSSMSVMEMPVLAGLPDLPASMNTLVLKDLPSITILPTFPNITTEAVVHDLPGLPVAPTWSNSIARLSLSLPHLSELSPWPTISPDLELLYMPLVEELPALPIGDRYLNIIGFSGLLELPELVERVDILEVEGSPLLTCVPLLPDSMTHLWLHMTGVTCLPNIPWLAYDPTSLQLCTMYNSTCPDLYPVVAGSVYHDANGNGVRDAGEGPLPLATVVIEPLGWTIGLDDTGGFSLGVPPGSYTLSVEYPSDHIADIQPASHSAMLAVPSDIDTDNDFGIRFVDGVQDLMVTVPWVHPAVPGFSNDLVLQVGNNGTVAMNGTVTLQLDADQAFMSADVTPLSVSGGTIAWAFEDLVVGASMSIQVVVGTDASVPLGTPIEHTVAVAPVSSDETPADNMFVVVDTVVGSFDPNDKHVDPGVMTPAELVAGERLTYTIRFQNTGTFPAQRVIVTDTLSTRLNWSTFRFTQASHAHTWVMRNGVLEVVFDGINLPDSTNDEANSHGFLTFSILADPGLMVGESIGNTANIYFDFNEPVITAQAVVLIDNGSTIQDMGAGELLAFPSPVRDRLNVRLLHGRMEAVEVLDARGRSVMRGSPVGHIEVGSLVPGLYVLRVYTTAGMLQSRFTTY